MTSTRLGSKRRGDATGSTEEGSSPKRAKREDPKSDAATATSVEEEAASIRASGIGAAMAEASEVAAAAAVAATAAKPTAAADADKSLAEKQFHYNSLFSTHGKPSLNPTNPDNFDHFLFQLLSYKADFHNYHVPKEEYPELHSWLQYLKREYKFHAAKMVGQAEAASAASASSSGPKQDDSIEAAAQGTEKDEDTTTAAAAPEDAVAAAEAGAASGDNTTNDNTIPECALTPEQIKVLQSLHIPLTSRGDDHWNRFFQLLQEYKERHNHVLVPRLCEIPGLGDWVTDQRRQYKAWKQGGASQLTHERRAKLESVGFAWQVRNRPEWDQRYKELLDYKEKHGDTKVPQHYKSNKALGKWVAKQREQYKLLNKGQHSFLTPYRLEKLNAAGFVWQVRTSIDSDDMVVVPATAAAAQTASVSPAVASGSTTVAAAAAASDDPAAAAAASTATTNNVPTPLAAAAPDLKAEAPETAAAAAAVAAGVAQVPSPEELTETAHV